MPPVHTLTTPYFYEASVNKEDRAPVSQERYLRIVGYLIYALQTRHDERPFVSFLSNQGTHPNVGDEMKALYVLRYLYSTPYICVVFSAMKP